MFKNQENRLLFVMIKGPQYSSPKPISSGGMMLSVHSLKKKKFVNFNMKILEINCGEYLENTAPCV